MQKRTLIMFIISLLFVFLIGLILFFFYDKESKITFYATVKEVKGDNYLVNPLPNEKIDYEEVNLVIKDSHNYKPGDILFITAKSDIAETYPVTIYVLSSKLYKKKTTEVTTEPVTDNIISENETTTQVNNNVGNLQEPNQEVSDILAEEAVISEFSNYITAVNSSGNGDSFKTKAKNYFISIIDFIFYDKEVSGYKFNDLTNGAKLKVIKIALELDNAINLKFPNYKSDLSSSYKNMKGKLVGFYLEKTSEFCQNNDAVCEEAKSGFGVLKTSLNLTWSFITSIGEVGVKELQNWYEIFSGK